MVDINGWDTTSDFYLAGLGQKVGDSTTQGRTPQ